MTEDEIRSHRFDEDDESARVLTSISPQCQREECAICPGIFDHPDADELVFCVHVCHKVKSAGGESAIS